MVQLVTSAVVKSCNQRLHSVHQPRLRSTREHDCVFFHQQFIVFAIVIQLFIDIEPNLCTLTASLIDTALGQFTQKQLLGLAHASLEKLRFDGHKIAHFGRS